jgi:adenylate kinase
MIASRSDRREESKIDGALLVIFAGLPGTGKTTIARALARDLGAVYLRIDSIEQAILASDGGSGPIDDRDTGLLTPLPRIISDSVEP